jgi:transcription-repair coupling factor (superfamily II helicase)
MAVPAASSLSLRALLFGAIERAGLEPGPGHHVSGLTPPAVALVLSAASRRSPIVAVVPADRDIDALVADVRFFAAALEGWSPAHAERVVLPCPSLEIDPYRDIAPHLDVTSARARALHALATGEARVVVASVAAIAARVSSVTRMREAGVRLQPDVDVDLTTLADRLVDAGFTRADPVDQHGEFCIRGGLVDVFPAGEAQPVRVEFLGDTVETMRRYDAQTQRSIETVDHVLLVPLRDVLPLPGGSGAQGADDTGGDAVDRDGTILGYAHEAGARVFVVESTDVLAHGEAQDAALAASHAEAMRRGRRVLAPASLAVPWAELDAALASATRLDRLAVDRSDRPVREIAAQSVSRHHGRVDQWVAELRKAREAGETTLFVAESAGRAERTIELLREYDVLALPVDATEVTRAAVVLVTTGAISAGVRLADAGVTLVAEGDVFDEDRVRRDRASAVGPSAGARRTFFSDFRDLKVGDHVVHVDHGIGMFVGLKKLTFGGTDAQEFMELRYADDNKLFVPVEHLDLVQKYSGGGRPQLDRLGGTTWEKAKTRVKKAMRDMADELLKLYATRKAVPGHAFGSDTHWQEEFEQAFEYELTGDQKVAIGDIKADMESPTPMDRLLCGDVGYGKTEVAMRAAFKAVMDGKQVAVLAPTTVLAFQHLRTLETRFAAFPVKIDMVSRFRSKQEQKVTLANLAEGKLDVIVGTHRLLSKDVVFHDLGLLVVDEEQRFGVAHKERIKQMRRKVDVLTMSATPIPRTLNMSLVGIRDMSVIETPPRDRLAIQTNVVAFDQKVIGDAVRHELERGGQVYIVHNRVESIHSIAGLVQRLVPEARIVVGHGQMGEDDLEKVMIDFVGRKFDVLVATTIIENGLDIPNANTMIINRADRYGLAQLYQLRGRVGRSDRRAYAYLLVPPGHTLSPVARRRLAAMREFSDLGAGFRVAALDLEIRGAGNLLGGEQSGHIEAIGFEMYLKLLEETIRELKGEELEDDARATLNLKIELRIDESYIPDMNQRLGVYRRLAAARTDQALEDAVAEVRDRYGPPPESVEQLAAFSSIRLLADRLRVEKIDREGSSIVFTFRPGGVDPARVISLVSKRPDITLVPPASLRLTATQPTTAPTVAAKRQVTRVESTVPKFGQKPETRQQSWWTQRATSGTVAPGFTREALAKPVKTPFDSPSRLFDQVRGVLTELTDFA